MYMVLKEVNDLVSDWSNEIKCWSRICRRCDPKYPHQTPDQWTDTPDPTYWRHCQTNFLTMDPWKDNINQMNSQPYILRDLTTSWIYILHFYSDFFQHRMSVNLQFHFMRWSYNLKWNIYIPYIILLYKHSTFIGFIWLINIQLSRSNLSNLQVMH